MSLINKNKDFEIIAGLIPNGSSIIDVGCNDGSLIEFLSENNNVNARGMEIDQKKVKKCLSKGISVVEGDADSDLYDYPDNLFDYSSHFQNSYILKITLKNNKSAK